MNRITKVSVVAGITTAGMVIASCSSNPEMSPAGRREQANQANIQDMRDRNQPVPQFPISEKRGVAIDIAKAQQQGVATMTFFFTQGVPDPSFQCPSIGYPLPGTTQLTNPQQLIYASNGSGGSAMETLHQMDPDGTYVGETSGMYVECVAPNGKSYVVHDGLGTPRTIGGPAHWDYDKHTIVLDGDPTATTTKKVGP